MNTEYKLFPFQREAVDNLKRRDIKIVGHDVGLGKSVISIAYCEEMNFKNVLIVCPAPLKEQWRNEIQKFYSQTAHILKGNARSREMIFNMYERFEDVKYLIVNYEQLRPSNKFLLNIKFDLIILDEAHRVKNFKSKTHKWGLKLKSHRRIALTATPITNNPLEAATITNFCKRKTFDYFKITDRYGVWGTKFMGKRLGHVQAVVDWKDLDQFKKQFSKHFMRKTKKEVLDQLPERFYKTYYIEFSEEEQKIHDKYYNLLKRAYELETDDIFSYLSLLQLVCNGISLMNESGSRRLEKINIIKDSKMQVLKEILEDFGDERVIIFTKYKKMAKILELYLGEDVTYVITGDTKNKFEAIEDFKKGDKKYLVSTDCLGYGVNLEFLNILIHFDLTWTPSALEQREGRLDRITQVRNMLIINLITKNSFEERILKILRRKNEYIKKSFGDRDIVNEIFKG